jgi:hypothetical protein
MEMSFAVWLAEWVFFGGMVPGQGDIPTLKLN